MVNGFLSTWRNIFRSLCCNRNFSIDRQRSIFKIKMGKRSVVTGPTENSINPVLNLNSLVYSIWFNNLKIINHSVTYSRCSQNLCFFFTTQCPRAWIFNTMYRSFLYMYTKYSCRELWGKIYKKKFNFVHFKSRMISQEWAVKWETES